MDAASAGVERLRNALLPPPEASADRHEFGAAVATDFAADFVEAMEDDLSTPRALAGLFATPTRFRPPRCISSPWRTAPE